MRVLKVATLLLILGAIVVAVLAIARVVYDYDGDADPFDAMRAADPDGDVVDADALQDRLPTSSCREDRRPVDGKCSLDGFVIKDGCCRLPTPTDDHGNLGSMVGGLAAAVGTDVVVHAILKKLQKKATEKATKKAGETAAEKAGEKAAQKSGEKAGETAAEKAAEKAAQKSGEKAGETAAEKAAEKAGEKVAGKLGTKIGTNRAEDTATNLAVLGAKTASGKAAGVAKKAAMRLTTHLANHIVNHATSKAEAKAASAAMKAAKKAAEKAAAAAAANSVTAAARKAASKAAAAAAEEAAEKAAEKAGEKISEHLAAKVAEKIAAELAEAAIKAAALSVIPIAGWVMDAVDASTLAMDLDDVGGYNNFISNETIGKMRDSILYANNQALLNNGFELPSALLFPIQAAFPDAKTKADDEFFNGHLITTSSLSLMTPSFRETVLQAIGCKTAACADDKELPASFEASLGPAVSAAFDATMSDFTTRDNYYLMLLRKHLPAVDHDKVTTCSFMSTKTILGVSLSESGVKWWYEKNRMGWLAHNGMFDPVPAAATPVPVALFTDQYRILDHDHPLTHDHEPKMTWKQLPQKVALSAPLGSVVSVCEKSKDVQNNGQSLDPYQFGVRFDRATGVCAFTREYCVNRLGLKFKASGETECTEDAGQEAGEMIQSTTAVRAGVRANSKKTTITFTKGIERATTAHGGACAKDDGCHADADCKSGKRCRASSPGKPKICS